MIFVKWDPVGASFFRVRALYFKIQPHLGVRTFVRDALKTSNIRLGVVKLIKL